MPMCKYLQYNATVMPNLLGHVRQDDAALEVHQFLPLVKIQCSSYFKPFMRLIYAPPCTAVLSEPIPPCRSLCSKAWDGCQLVLNRYGFSWPEILDCEIFPVNGLCINFDEQGQYIIPDPLLSWSSAVKTLNWFAWLYGRTDTVACCWPGCSFRVIACWPSGCR